MDDKQMRDLMERAMAAVREELGNDFEKLGYILLIRTREAGQGFYALGSDVNNRELVSATLQMGALLVEREPERMMRPPGSMH